MNVKFKLRHYPLSTQEDFTCRTNFHYLMNYYPELAGNFMDKKYEQLWQHEDKEGLTAVDLGGGRVRVAREQHKLTLTSPPAGKHKGLRKKL